MQHEFDLPNIERSADLTLMPQTINLLSFLAEQGLHKELIAFLMEMAGVQQDHLRWLRGPVIQHLSPWMDVTPSWIFQAITAERVRLILDERAHGEIGWQVGPAELTAVMMPAMLDAPQCYEFSQIYLWACAQAFARRDSKPVADIWQSIGCKPVTDDQVIRPGGAYFEDYRRLASDIRRRVMKAQQERERPSRASPPRCTPQPQTSIQGSLF